MAHRGASTASPPDRGQRREFLRTGQVVATRASVLRRPGPSAPVASTVIRATALDGKSVQSQTGEGVGDVEDLVVKLPEAKLPYVVIVTADSSASAACTTACRSRR